MGATKLDLITKLLSKAESTTPEEAEALTEHAERLMLKYSIEQARIDERRARTGAVHEEIVQERMLFTGVYARDLRELGASVALALSTVHPLYGSESASAMYLIGHASDVRQTQVLTASLQVQAMTAMRSWWNVERHRYRWASESDRRRARSGFIRGFGAGVAERIRENRRTVVEENGSGTDLVLASRRDRVGAFVRAIPTRRARQRRAWTPNRSSAARARAAPRAPASVPWRTDHQSDEYISHAD